ncbi:sigma-70 family RNA polymerase sigma factor [Thiomicrorhabdus sp. zzn3]|uniref:RNA polymerase sigma factor n=1 Tax=Thiomicrorhabdus sp. zzn3 TaxID=3039775 RepID=UPI002436BA85|nr:sigma-70 family RNA polymerase sigma factor [Thiomicrorhabdus sp. zzn3]MDG6778787.1 sigma-70 family RNA polymerase sigma factor [Thiomicrorhabdus sp. zzn3]
MKLSSKVADLFCASRDRREFNAALKQQYDSLYRLAYAWCHQPAVAQDLVQETMLKALESRKDLNSLQHLSAWLTKIMRNQFLDEMRFNRRWEWADESEIDEHHCSHCNESELIKKQRNESLYVAISKLPFEQREAILLADLQGFSYQEIAEITATPIGTVMSRISRGRERLRGLLKKQDSQPNVVPLRRH